MRRRVKLALADAVVSDRFLLWGLMAIVVASGVMTNSVAMALHVEVFSTPWILLFSSCTGLAQAVLLVLAFVPPRSYLSWVRARDRIGSLTMAGQRERRSSLSTSSTGRTSMLPSRADGHREATWIASSRSLASIRKNPPSCSLVSA